MNIYWRNLAIFTNTEHTLKLYIHFLPALLCRCTPKCSYTGVAGMWQKIENKMTKNLLLIFCVFSYFIVNKTIYAQRFTGNFVWEICFASEFIVSLLQFLTLTPKILLLEIIFEFLANVSIFDQKCNMYVFKFKCMYE